MTTKHTPGPWKADGIVVRSKFGDQICMFSPWIRQTADQLEDNIRLIAAAPDLLEALIELADTGAEAWGEDRPCVRWAYAAIAKATGESSDEPR